MRVKVIQEDINEGIKESPYSCAIAKALKRSTPYLAELSFAVSVIDESYKIIQDIPNGWGRLSTRVTRKYRLPVEAQQFICAFDNEETVSPFEFEGEEI